MHCWWSKTIWRRVTSAHSLSASNISACRQQHLFPARHWQQPCEKDQSWGLVGLQGENPPSCSPERWMSCSGYSLENERCSEGQGDRRKIGGQQDRPVNQVFWVQGGQRQQEERCSPSPAFFLVQQPALTVSRSSTPQQERCGSLKSASSWMLWYEQRPQSAWAVSSPPKAGLSLEQAGRLSNSGGAADYTELGDWGFLVSRRDLRSLIKNYLNGLGIRTRKRHILYYNITPIWSN